MKQTIKVERDVEITKIALTGKLRSGKDLCANHLYIKYGFERVAFGDALKDAMYVAFPWVSPSTKPRALMQQFGQLMRQIDPDVWIKHAEREVQGAIDYRVHSGAERVGVVITDLRQPNEFSWARANGFSIVRISAPEEQRLARAQAAGDAFSLADLEHETESYIDGFDVDFTVFNCGSVDELKASVGDVLTKINGAK